MSDNYFREGGPYNARQTSEHEMTYQVSIEADEYGRVARQCPNDSCSPGYFKVKLGTGITEEQSVAYCPYCRFAENPSGFFTEEQKRYMQEILFQEATLAFQGMMNNATRGNKYMSFKPGHLPDPRKPFEDKVQRDVICPHCGLDHAVFGLATYCPDCGKDIFMTHVEAEYNVVRAMLGDIERRQKELGSRIAARDLENCLEDIVSIFEAVMKVILTRYLSSQGESDEDIKKLFQERFRNGFQNPERAQEIIRNRMKQELFNELTETDIQFLVKTYAKRHPITHNLGVIDQQYLKRIMESEQEGKDIFVTTEEIEKAIILSLKSLKYLYQHISSDSESPEKHD